MRRTAFFASALLGARKTDLAIGRGDLGMPADAQTLAVLRKNYVVLWSPSGRPGKDSKKKPTGKIAEIADLAGHKVGIIGRSGANRALLRTILVGSGMEPDNVATVQFGTEAIEKLAQDATLDAFIRTFGPVHRSRFPERFGVPRGLNLRAARRHSFWRQTQP